MKSWTGLQSRLGARRLLPSPDLRKRGYKWFEFLQDGSLRPHIRREDYLEVRNYLAVPEEKLEIIESFNALGTESTSANIE